MKRLETLLATKGKWFDDIASGEKQFDWRKGFRNIEVGDVIRFAEANEFGVETGISCMAKVNRVLYSSEFPPHFRWKGGEFTIIQFRVEE